MFLLLGGTGVGYSVQQHHVEQLPEIRKPNADKTRRFLLEILLKDGQINFSISKIIFLWWK
jgi:hypothetical protein